MMGIPGDQLMRSWFPSWLVRFFAKSFVRLTVGSYTRYGLQEPDHDIFEHHPTVNSDLLHCLQLGKIKPHQGKDNIIDTVDYIVDQCFLCTQGNIDLNTVSYKLTRIDIKCYSGNTVEFVDGSKDDYDLIIFCTGYHTSFPMFKPGFIPFKDGAPQLVGSMLPDHKHLYVIGIGQPRYGTGSLVSYGANLALTTMIRTQDKLKYPLGKILFKLKLTKIAQRVRQHLVFGDSNKLIGCQNCRCDT
jgi:hypothetical protein